MPYDIWRTDEAKGAPSTTQAFVFDGWSHEPLVIMRKQGEQATSQDGRAAVVVSRPIASRIG